MTERTGSGNWMPRPGREGIPSAQALRRRFPGTPVWFGVYTCRWWAMVRVMGEWHLIEAQELDELSIKIIHFT